LADLIEERINTDIAALSIHAWAMYFDWSVCGDGCGIGILLVSPRGETYSLSIRLPTACTNNLAEYEAVTSWGRSWSSGNFRGFKIGDLLAHRGIQVWERVALPIMGAMLRADGPI
jgi:hypothetical protein